MHLLRATRGSCVMPQLRRSTVEIIFRLNRDTGPFGCPRRLTILAIGDDQTTQLGHYLIGGWRIVNFLGGGSEKLNGERGH